jgi:hypothetical protein
MGQPLALSLLSWLRLNQIFYTVLLLNLPKNLDLVVSRMKTDTGTLFIASYRFEHMLMIGRAPVRARRPPGIRTLVSGISRDTSWQVRRSTTFIACDRETPERCNWGVMTTCCSLGFFLEQHADGSRTLPLSHRISRTLVARLVTFHLPTLTAIIPVKGTSHLFWSYFRANPGGQNSRIFEP